MYRQHYHKDACCCMVGALPAGRKVLNKSFGFFFCLTLALPTLTFPSPREGTRLRSGLAENGPGRILKLKEIIAEY